MAQVSVKINGRSFRMGCEDGQEAHLTALAERLESRIVEMRGKVGEIGDNRLTVMAAITLADELSEAQGKIAALEVELARHEAARMEAARRTNATHGAIIAAFDSASGRIEAVARGMGRQIYNQSMS